MKDCDFQFDEVLIGMHCYSLISKNHQVWPLFQTTSHSGSSHFCSRPSCWRGWACLFFFSSITSVVDGEESAMGSRGQFTGRRVEDYFVRVSSTLGSLGEAAQTVSHSDPPARSKAQQLQCEPKRRRRSTTGCAPHDGSPSHRTQHRLQPASELGNWKQFSQRWRTTTRLLQSSRLLGRKPSRHRNGHSRNVSSHKDVRGEAAEEGRTFPCECRQGQGGSGRSSALPGEGKIFVGRWRREVVAVACRSETSPFTLHRSTSASRPRHPRRDATYAACHRRIATR